MRCLKQNLKVNKHIYKVLLDYSIYSNNLYNYAQYVCRQYYFSTNQYIGINQLSLQVSSNQNYKLLPAQSAQQIIRQVDKNYRSFFALLRKKKEGHYTQKVNIPRYRKKGDKYNIT